MKHQEERRRIQEAEILASSEAERPACEVLCKFLVGQWDDTPYLKEI